MVHRYTKEQAEFITNNVKGKMSNELTEMFNNHFNLNLKVSQIRSFMNNRKVKNGLDCRFKKGQIPSNKGKKGICAKGCEKTWFKKGNISPNAVEIGTEIVNGDGYTEMKLQDGELQKNWKGKHILIWEKHNGPVPKNHVVIFGDGDKRNLDINNLILVSRQQLLILNKNNLIQEDADLTRTGVIIADMYKKISERKKA